MADLGPDLDSALRFADPAMKESGVVPASGNYQDCEARTFGTDPSKDTRPMTPREFVVGSLVHQILTSRWRGVTSLIEEFHYPRLGPGMMWERAAEPIGEGGGSVDLGAQVVAIQHAGGRVTGVGVSTPVGERVVTGTDFIASMPISEWIARLEPPAPKEVREAAEGLRYRDLLTVCLIVARPDLFPDNWIYVHKAGVRVARIQNFKNWSPDMTPDGSKTTLGLEYFCAEGDALWRLSDAELFAIARTEIATIGLACAEEVEDGCVFPAAERAYAAKLEGQLAETKTAYQALIDGPFAALNAALAKEQLPTLVTPQSVLSR